MDDLMALKDLLVTMRAKWCIKTFAEVEEAAIIPRET